MPRRDHTYWEIPVDPAILARFPAAAVEPSRDPDKQRIIDEAVAQLRTIIESGLTARQREVVQAYFFDGRTEAEIAQQLGIAQQVVSRHLFGALRAGRRVGGAMAKLRRLAEELGIVRPEAALILAELIVAGLAAEMPMQTEMLPQEARSARPHPSAA